MPWSISFAQDTKTKGVGTATASHDDGVSHSAVIDTNSGNGIGDFIAIARALLAKVQAEKSEANAVVAKIEAELNK